MCAAESGAMLSVDKPMSLVETKKQQWAREREEMSRFYVPWGSDSQSNRLQLRNQFASTLELHKESSYEYADGPQRQRSPSLPPIRNQAEIANGDNSRRSSRDFLNRNISSEKRFVFYDEEGEGDTSGYGSETINHLNKRQHGALNDMSSRHDRGHDPVVAWQTKLPDNRSKDSGSNTSTPPALGRWTSVSSRHGGSGGEEGRLKWGDRGVATGRLWEPQEPTARLPQMQIQKKGTPSWVERGLNMLENSTEVLIIDQQSNHSGGLEYDRSSCNGSDGGRNTFLRGQNVPLEPEVKAQRETKRMKALELQNAILNQLEEREKNKREEREQKLREERLEELRIQRQQEEDRLRITEERRKNEEKRHSEQRKMEALKKAIEDAEKKAKIEKEKLFSSHKFDDNNLRTDTISQNSFSAAAIQTPDNDSNTKFSEAKNNMGSSKQSSPRKSFSTRTYDVNSAQSHENNHKEISRTNSNANTPRSASTGNVNLYLHGLSSVPFADAQVGILPIGITPDLISPMVNPPNGFQLAVLVPHNNTGLYNLSQPVSLQSLNSLIHIDENSQTGKLLTPRKYRSLKSRDVSTQTDPQLQKPKAAEQDQSTHNVDKNYQNIDENAPQESHNIKKERRFRSEERYKKDIETRPKWGVNRPAAQYKKQSEKDPFYSQKRKLRQKYRPQPIQYLSHSSDESRSPSPPTQSEILQDTKSRISLSQSHWRSKRSTQDILRPSNMSVEKINITPLEYNHLGQVTLGVDLSEETHNIPHSSKMSPTKRVTLSQKFINDKYGNRKLWNDEPSADRNYKSTILELDTVRDRKKFQDQLNTAKRDDIENSEDQNLVFRSKLN